MSRKSSDASSIILAIIIALPIIVGCSALGGYIFMLLWNWALVGIFPAIPLLDFYRAWGLTILLGIVGSFFKSSK